MTEPQSKEDWETILDALGLVRVYWDQFQAVGRDVRDFGTGYLRFTPFGIEHVPLEKMMVRLDRASKIEGDAI